MTPPVPGNPMDLWSALTVPVRRMGAQEKAPGFMIVTLDVAPGPSWAGGGIIDQEHLPLAARAASGSVVIGASAMARSPHPSCGGTAP